MTSRIREDFAAAGGGSLGLVLAGLPGGVGIENEPRAVETARAAGHARILADVQEVRDWDWDDLDGYKAGPPCQPFSEANNSPDAPNLQALVEAVQLVAGGWTPEDAIAATGAGLLDERSTLVLEPMLVAVRHRPTWILLEQVPKVLAVWQAFVEPLQGLGYSVVTGVLNAEQYGVPQARKRAVLAARLDGTAVLPTPTHSLYHRTKPAKLDEGVLSWVSMAEALGPDYVPVPAIPGETLEDVRDWPWRCPSPTIVGSFRPDVVAKRGYRLPGGPSRQNTPGSVKVTPAQAGVLQSFPVDYPWQGTESEQFKQIGNAAPPLLVKAVVEAIRS